MWLLKRKRIYGISFIGIAGFFNLHLTDMNVQEARDPWDLKKFWFSKETLSKAEIENNDVESCQIMNRAKKQQPFIKMTVNNNSQ